jgi:hypothetical protein
MQIIAAAPARLPLTQLLLSKHDRLDHLSVTWPHLSHLHGSVAVAPRHNPRIEVLADAFKMDKVEMKDDVLR